MPNSGYVDYINLEEYYLDNSVSTGNVKSNTFGDPDYIPTFYDTSLCPLISLTPTPTTTPTPTPSPTSPGVSGRYKVNFYSSLLNVSALNEEINVYYKLDNGNWNRLGSAFDVKCIYLNSIIVNGGQTLYTAVMTGSTTGTDISDGTGTDVDTSFYTAEARNCDYTNILPNTFCGKTLPYSTVVLSDMDISLGAIIDETTYTLKDCGTGLGQKIIPTPSSSPGPYFNGNITIASTLLDACAGNYSATTINVIGNNSVYCKCGQFYSSYFSAIDPGVYYVTDVNGYSFSITTNGTYFATVNESSCTLCSSVPVTPTPTLTPTPSPSNGVIPSITSFGADLFGCATPNDYIGYYVNMDYPTYEDISVTLNIALYDNSGFKSRAFVNVGIPAGSITNTIGKNPCLDGGILSQGLYPYEVCIGDIKSGSLSIINPFGYCSGPIESPSATPSPTPTVTATPTKTPTLTPTKTPSITPTATRSLPATPTPTSTPIPSTAPNFIVINNGDGTGEIKDVVKATDDTRFYNITSGAYNVTYGNTLYGKFTEINVPIRVELANLVALSGKYSLTLYKNGILQRCQSVYVEQTLYTFEIPSMKSSDIMTIKFEAYC
jgi:hypothetical protein